MEVTLSLLQVSNIVDIQQTVGLSTQEPGDVFTYAAPLILGQLSTTDVVCFIFLAFVWLILVSSLQMVVKSK